MILTVDIGNTNISVAGFREDEKPQFIKTYPDNLFHTKEEFIKAFSLLEGDFSGAVLCSVVPALGTVVKAALKELVGENLIVLDHMFNDGMKISGYDRRKLGNDRIADMTAAKALYGTPAIIFDMGTATTVSVLDKEGVFIGGMIMPGLGLSINSLSSGTALLPGIRPYEPNSLLGQDTVSCINNGVIFQQAASVEGISSRVEESLGEKIHTVITGGGAKFILPVLRRQVHYDEHLLMKGLRILYNK